MNHGLILEPIVENDHYELGGYSGITDRPVLMPGGHGWGAYKPKPELQNKNGFETMNCTNYGTHNALETLAAFKGLGEFPKDCSERYSGCLTGTTPSGNNPHAVIEIIRTDIGVVPEVDLPFTDDITTWDEYYTVQSATWLKPFGRTFLDLFKIGHEWVFAFGSTYTVSQKQQRLTEALQYGTVSVSVLAWHRHPGATRYYKPDGYTDNHWVQLLDFVEGESWTVYDHYEEVEKELEWDYDFNAAKVYYLDRQAQAPRRTFWQIVIAGMKGLGLLS